MLYYTTLVTIIILIGVCEIVFGNTTDRDWSAGWEEVLSNQRGSFKPTRPNQPPDPPDSEDYYILSPLPPHHPPSSPRRFKSAYPRPPPIPTGKTQNVNGAVAKGTDYQNEQALPMVNPSLILEAHNMYRKLAGVPLLDWDSGLASVAQAHSLNCLFEHSKKGYGENLIMGNYNEPIDLFKAVTMWYGEICYYDFSNPGFSLSTGHYTQVVWKGTKFVGCGYTECKNGVKPYKGYKAGIMVCEYYPPGNVLTLFDDNVQKPRVTPECNTGLIKWNK